MNLRNMSEYSDHMNSTFRMEDGETLEILEQISGQNEELNIREDDNRLSVVGSDFEYIFDMENGSLMNTH